MGDFNFHMITRSIVWKHQLYYNINLDDNFKNPNHKQQRDAEKKRRFAYYFQRTYGLRLPLKENKLT